MADVKIVEGTFQVDGATLFTKSWLPEAVPTKAKLLMVHGFSDHVDRYYDFFPTLARRGIAVHGFDQRGWGRSVRTPSDRGRSGPTSLILSDIAAFAQSRVFPASPADAPVFILGHSMGGGEVLTLASTPAYQDAIVSKVRGWILEAPFLGFAPELQPHWLTVAGGRVAARVMPRFQMVQGVPPKHLCRDVDVQESLAADSLLHNTGTLEGLAAMIDRAERLYGGKLRLGEGVKSVFLAHGTGDMATSFERAREWWDRQRFDDGWFKAYEGFFHQLHAEPGKEEFYRDVGDWILERCDGDGLNLRESAPEAKL